MQAGISFLEYVFSDPSALVIIAIIFFVLGASFMYFYTKNGKDYVNALKKENETLRYEKNKWAERALEWKEILNGLAENDR